MNIAARGKTQSIALLSISASGKAPKIRVGGAGVGDRVIRVEGFRRYLIVETQELAKT